MIEEVVKKRMRELGITQKQMAEKAKMTQPQLSNFFNKKHPITTVTLERIIQELNLIIRQKDN